MFIACKSIKGNDSLVRTGIFFIGHFSVCSKPVLTYSAVSFPMASVLHVLRNYRTIRWAPYIVQVLENACAFGIPFKNTIGLTTNCFSSKLSPI